MSLTLSANELQDFRQQVDLMARPSNVAIATVIVLWMLKLGIRTFIALDYCLFSRYQPLMA